MVLFEGISQSAVEVFKAAGYAQIELLPKSLAGDELKAKIAGAHIVGIRSRTQLTAEVLADARKLITVGCFCIGTNQVDLEAAELAGIPVFNAPYSNTRSVAELVVAEAILLMRGILEGYGYQIEPLHLSLWAIPTAIAAFLIHGFRLRRLEKRMQGREAGA